MPREGRLGNQLVPVSLKVLPMLTVRFERISIQREQQTPTLSLHYHDGKIVQLTASVGDFVQLGE